MNISEIPFKNMPCTNGSFCAVIVPICSTFFGSNLIWPFWFAGFCVSIILEKKWSEN